MISKSETDSETPSPPPSHFSPVFRLASIRRYRWYHPEISCAPTPLLIDGHAVGDANINRRVVIRAYTLCASHGKQYFTSATIVVAQSDLSSVLLFLSVSLLLHPILSPSLSLSLFSSSRTRCSSFFARSFLFLACGFLRRCLSRLGPETWVCLTDAKTNICRF